MRVAAHQSNFLPWVGYWNKLASVECLIDMDYAQYVKGEYYNRVKIGESWATVPVTNIKGPISLVRIDHTRQDLLRLSERIRQTYAKAPHHGRLAGIIDYLREGTPDTLVELNNALRQQVCRVLAIQTPTVQAVPGEGETTEDRLWSMIMKTCPGATEYYSGSGGRNYMGDSPLLPTKFQEVTNSHGGGSVLHLIAHDPSPADAIRACANWRD